MISTGLLPLVCAWLMSSAAIVQDSYTPRSQTPPLASRTAPSILKLKPKIAPAGTEVTIIGSNFKDVESVLFDDMAAKFTVISETEIRAIVPIGAKSGPIQIVAGGGTFRSKELFEVDNSQH